MSGIILQKIEVEIIGYDGNHVEEVFFWHLFLTHLKLNEVPLLNFCAPAVAIDLALLNPEVAFLLFAASLLAVVLSSSSMAPIPPAPH